ncbi:MAG: class B sortase [Eggerthia catenaformis]|uniref:class B sortase n=1 Tax=Eggerthia catenaformis TaxID=31973 RepID=UPI003F9EFFAD
MFDKIRKVLLIVCVGVFLYASFNLGKIFYDYYQVDKQTEEIKDEYVKPKENKKSVENPLERKIDFVSLKKRNKDVAGWIYIPGTKIDEVILYGKTNDTYIHTTIDKKYSFAGEVFMDSINKPDFTDSQTIIYGHNMKNGSRFAALRKFSNKEFFDKNPYVYIYLPDGSIYVYSVYVIKKVNATEDKYYTNNVDYNKYIKQLQSGAVHTRSVSNKKAPLVLLSTCVAASGEARWVVGGRLEKVVK